MKRDRLKKVDMNELDRKYESGRNYISRLGPRGNPPTNVPLLSEDDDAFLTEKENRLLFPHRFGINPQTIKKERNRFLAPRAFTRASHRVSEYFSTSDFGSSQAFPRPHAYQETHTWSKFRLEFFLVISICLVLLSILIGYFRHSSQY